MTPADVIAPTRRLDQLSRGLANEIQLVEKPPIRLRPSRLGQGSIPAPLHVYFSR